MNTRGGAAAVVEKSSDRVRLKVLYDFEYETRGKQVRIVKDERLLLLKKTNSDWWQVVRPADVTSIYVPEQSTFYVPTGYVAEEDPLPQTTRFYVDKDRMFKPPPAAESSPPTQSNDATHSPQEVNAKEEPRKAHESFRNVIRKLSGNLSSVNDGNKPVKPAKASKIIKNLRKNSMGSSEDVKIPPSGKSSLVPVKHKDSWESSAFGMCFGRDMKNSDAQMLNPFQEELENALSNRVSQKKIVLDSKLGLNKQPVDQVLCDDKDRPTSKFESIQDKWEKASAQVLKKPDNFHFVPLSKIKEDAQRRQSMLKSEVISDISPNSAKCPSLEVEKIGPKKSVVQQQLNRRSTDASQTLNKPVDNSVPETNDKNVIAKQDIDRLLINDKRKMWAIETLMSELLQSSTNSKLNNSTENNESGISGPNQLAQELHEMSVSRRFENAEIQVNLLDNKYESNTKDNNKQPSNDDTMFKMESWKRKVFDFPPCTNILKTTPKSPTTRSPKLLDEYNEANILNDNDNRPEDDLTKDMLLPVDYESSTATPTSSISSMRIKREKVPFKLNMSTKHSFHEESVASDVKFSPEHSSLDLDCPTTTLSQDSLRLYKRRSKSDGALNKRDPRRRDSVDSQRGRADTLEARQQHLIERKYTTQHGSGSTGGSKHSIVSGGGGGNNQDRQATRYKLNRKSRSLGDLDCSEIEEKQEDEEEEEEDDAASTRGTESRRRYKPVPKLRSKESLRRLKPSTPLAPPSGSTERLPVKPVPAKRRIIQQPIHQQQQQQQPTGDSSYDDLSEIDIERSTAVGFKALLRTSDSGSEEFLQYKTFPAAAKAQQLSPYEQSRLAGIQSISRSDGNVNLTRSLSDEVILSSASCSSNSPSRLLDGSVENLVDLPVGWTQVYDSNAKRFCFINERGDKWFSSNDSEGKIYFFEENSNESSWALPTIITENRVRTISNGDWPQLFDGNMCILKEGVINKTKITTENGKKLRKNWSTSYAVLTELFLLFFKDAKTFAAMKMDQSATAKPDISVDLNGAFIESSDKLSNRKNVYLINTLLGLQVLIQWDNALVIAEWYREIHDAIQRLPFSQEYGKSSSSRE